MLIEDVGDGCVADGCLAGAATVSDVETLVFQAVPGVTYYVVVDGATAADDGDFALSMSCGSPPTAEVCFGGADEDGDGLVDCADEQCDSDPACDPAEDCASGVDEDGDGLVDCADGDCAASDECVVEACDNGLDDDGDEAIDCQDLDCASTPLCAGLEVCDNGLDDDGDGAVDCGDVDCDLDDACGAIQCFGGIPLACDTPISGTTVGADDAISQYECNNLTQLGGDQLFRFTPASIQDFGVVLTANDGTDLTLVQLPGAFGCSPALCDNVAATQEDPETLTSILGGGSTAYFVVDSEPGQEGAFTIEVTCNPVVTEDCGDGSDNDGDGLADCDDPNCATVDDCLDVEDCTDNADNDTDGLVDCLDPDCALFFSCVAEDCDDGADNDLDGNVDCDDADCISEPSCQDEVCFNGIDDDGDGGTDCQDDDCSLDPYCGGEGVESCDNGVDDDGDELIDCADADCAADGACSGEVCQDGLDNDGDGELDCDDPDCAPTASCIDLVCPAATVATCGSSISGVLAGSSGADYYGCGVAALGPEDVLEITPLVTGLMSLSLSYDEGRDLDLVVTTDPSGACQADTCVGSSTTSNQPETLAVPIFGGETYFVFVDSRTLFGAGDYDLQIDCGFAATVEVCDSGLDDDGDGAQDCDDSDCATDPACAFFEACGDNLDNDGDGAIDCGDPDCADLFTCGATEEDCDDGLDDDNDGAIDCVDTDCEGAPECD